MEIQSRGIVHTGAEDQVGAWQGMGVTELQGGSGLRDVPIVDGGGADGGGTCVTIGTIQDHHPAIPGHTQATAAADRAIDAENVVKGGLEVAAAGTQCDTAVGVQVGIPIFAAHQQTSIKGDVGGRAGRHAAKLRVPVDDQGPTVTNRRATTVTVGEAEARTTSHDLHAESATERDGGKSSAFIVPKRHLCRAQARIHTGRIEATAGTEVERAHRSGLCGEQEWPPAAANEHLPVS